MRQRHEKVIAAATGGDLLLEPAGSHTSAGATS